MYIEVRSSAHIANIFHSYDSFKIFMGKPDHRLVICRPITDIFTGLPTTGGAAPPPKKEVSMP